MSREINWNWCLRAMRLKGKIGHLKRTEDPKKGILTIEVEFPTVDEQFVYGEGMVEGSNSTIWHVPNEITVYFHEREKGNLVDRLSKSQLLDILTQAIEEKKLKPVVLFKYQGGVVDFSKEELDVIRQYAPEEKKLLPIKKGRMIRNEKRNK